MTGPASSDNNTTTTTTTNQTPTVEDALRFVRQLDPDEREALRARYASQPRLAPLPGPQTQAFNTPAHVTLFGGSAGGGKSMLAIILALTKHERTLYIRKEAAQLYAVQDEIETLLGSRDGFNSQTNIWRLPKHHPLTNPTSLPDPPQRTIRFGGLNRPGDATKYQGAPRDLLVIDEAANVSFDEYQFLTVWSRTATQGQRTRVLLASNPPTDATGMWLIELFRPWLDPDYPNPAVSGEIRWFITTPSGEQQEVPSSDPVVIDGETFSPESRTFIRSSIDDNPYLLETGYKQRLQSLPKYLRDRMLHGHFLSELRDDEAQVIPSDWVDAAMERASHSNPPPAANLPVDAMGVDPSRGGADEMVIARRHRNYIEPLIKIAGHEVPTGPHAAAHVALHRTDDAPVFLDVIGIGSSVLDKLEENGIPVVPMTGNEATEETCANGIFRFRNKRSLWWWRLREMLDPDSGVNLVLPKDRKLKADLCAFTYTIQEGNVIKVESKKDARRRLGRSPDAGDAVIYACAEASVYQLKHRHSRQNVRPRTTIRAIQTKKQHPTLTLPTHGGASWR